MSNSKNPPEEKITQEEILKAIGSSGYLIEGRVANVLHSEGFNLAMNPVYLDPITKKIEK